MDGYFEYTVEYFDEIDSEACVERGVVYADSYAEAVRLVESFYGDTINSLSIVGLEPCEVYVLEGPNKE